LVQEGASQIFGSLGKQQGEEFARGYEIEIRDKKGKNLVAAVRLWAESGDTATAFKTAAIFKREEYMRYALGAIAEAQAGFGDIVGAMKTADRLQEPNFTGSIRYSIVKTQVRNGEIAAAQGTADLIPDGVSKEWAQYAIQNRQPIVPGRYDVHLPFERELLDRSITQDLWLSLLDDTDPIHDCPLNTAPFLDLANQLNSQPSADDPQLVFDALCDAADRISLARHVIDQMLKTTARLAPTTVR